MQQAQKDNLNIGKYGPGLDIFGEEIWKLLHQNHKVLHIDLDYCCIHHSWH
jgi:hypothetical protein